MIAQEPNICDDCREPYSDGVPCACERPITDSAFDADRHLTLGQDGKEVPADPDAAEQLQTMEDAAHWHQVEL
jgi:hypothetical protein